MVLKEKGMSRDQNDINKKLNRHQLGNDATARDAAHRIE